MRIENDSTFLETRVAYLSAYHVEVLFEMASEYKEGLLANLAVEKVLKLCIAYFDKYHSAPGDKIHEIVDVEAEMKRISDKALPEVKMVLASFVSQQEPDNIEYEIDTIFKYFTRQAVVLVSDEASDLCSRGQSEQAAELLRDVVLVDRKRLQGGHILEATDQQIEMLFADVEENLIELPGQLGVLMNNTLVRQGFVSLFGRNKVGKSHWLIYLARIARNQGRRGILISAGDMTQNQTDRRILQGDARTTFSEQYLDKQLMPVFDCLKNQNGSCFERESDTNLLNDFNEINAVMPRKGYVPCTKCKECVSAISYRRMAREVLSPQMARRVRNAWQKTGNPGVLHVEAFASGSLTCSGLQGIVQKVCKKYGWEHPDVIVLDYADIMADEGRDERASVNKRWRFLRSLSDTANCLVVTATQANSSSFDFEDLTLRAFSEDRRKLDHVTAFFAINQKPEERQKDIWRIAALNKREHPFNEAHQAQCHGCLALGSPHFISEFKYSEPPAYKPR